MATNNLEFLGIKGIDLGDDTAVAAAGQITNNLQPPEGYCYKILTMDYKAPDPAGSSAGTHRLLLIYKASLCEFTTDIYMASGTSNTGTGVYIAYHSWSADSEVPSVEADQMKLFTDLWASYDNPLSFVYNNDTDVQQAGTRELALLVAVYRQVV